MRWCFHVDQSYFERVGLGVLGFYGCWNVGVGSVDFRNVGLRIVGSCFVGFYTGFEVDCLGVDCPVVDSCVDFENFEVDFGVCYPD